VTTGVHTRRLGIWDLPAGRFWAWAAEHFRHPGGALRFQVRLGSPAECAAWLRGGEVDLALISPLEYARYHEHYELLPQVSVSTRSANPTARLFLGKPLDAIRTIALDPRAVLEAVVAYLVLLEHYQEKPAFVPLRKPDLQEGLHRADAVLLVGEEALLTPYQGVVLDLGQEWFELTTMPMVWGLWAAPPETLDDATVSAFLELARWAESHRSRYVCGLEPFEVYRDYFDQLRIDLDAHLKAGLEDFLEYCFLHGLLEEVPMLDFYRWPPPEKADAEART
jgi:predicted solute-binding protein